MKISKNIVLLGTGGVGKTTLGRMFADQHGLNFFDIDHIIEEKEGLSIPDIFVQKGEDVFRTLEAEMTQSTVKNQKNAVISLGGGAYMNSETRAYLKTSAISVFLKADFDTLLARIGQGEGRPMLKCNPEQKLRKLIHERYPVYEEADLIIKVSQEPIEETYHRLTQALYKVDALS